MASQAHQAILKQTILETVADELIASIKLFMPLIKPIVRPALLLRAWPHIPTAHWCGTSVHWAPATQSSLSPIHPKPDIVTLNLFQGPFLGSRLRRREARWMLKRVQHDEVGRAMWCVGSSDYSNRRSNQFLVGWAGALTETGASSAWPGLAEASV